MPLTLLLGSSGAQAQPVKVDPVYQSGFETGALSLAPPFSIVNEGSLNAPTHPGPLFLQLHAPVVSDTFVPIISSEPARLEVPGGGVTVLNGQQSAVVMVNAYQAGPVPIVLTAELGNILTAGVRVEKVLNETDLPAEMDYCATLFPAYFSVKTGVQSPALFARVFETGVTPFAGAPLGWLVGAGYGPAGTDPRMLADWHWVAAAYNLQAGDDDEYTAAFIAPQSGGVYNFVFRMSLDGGGSWTYCDYDGSGSNGGLAFSLDQLPLMYVYGDDVRNETDADEEADYCVLQFPPSITVETNGKTETVYGQLFESGETESAGPPAGWIGQAGFGPLNSDPRAPGVWEFTEAPYNIQDGDNDEFGVPLIAPESPGQYAYAFRFSNDSGTTWTYCDLDGAGSDSGLSFEPAKLGVMTVNLP